MNPAKELKKIANSLEKMMTVKNALRVHEVADLDDVKKHMPDFISDTEDLVQKLTSLHHNVVNSYDDIVHAVEDNNPAAAEDIHKIFNTEIDDALSNIAEGAEKLLLSIKKTGDIIQKA